jgi:hypothetical protein
MNLKNAEEESVTSQRTKGNKKGLFEESISKANKRFKKGFFGHTTVGYSGCFC